MTPGERRWLRNRRARQLQDEPLMAIDGARLLAIDPEVFGAWILSEDEVVRARIDEEGCGAIYAAVISLAAQVLARGGKG